MEDCRQGRSHNKYSLVSKEQATQAYTYFLMVSFLLMHYSYKGMCPSYGEYTVAPSLIAEQPVSFIWCSKQNIFPTHLFGAQIQNLKPGMSLGKVAIFCWFSDGVATLCVPHMHEPGRVVGRCALVLSHRRTKWQSSKECISLIRILDI
jgi:hypothetical protein